MLDLGLDGPRPSGAQITGSLALGKSDIDREDASAKRRRPKCAMARTWGLLDGAGDGNRTRTVSLGI